MLLYRCPSYVTEVSDGQCYRGGMGDACFAVVAAWGIGGRVREGPSPNGSVCGAASRVFFHCQQAYQLPENTGIPIGGEDHEVFYRLEIHYNNPNKEAGWRHSAVLAFEKESSKFWTRPCSLQAGQTAQDWGSTTGPPSLGSTTWARWPQGCSLAMWTTTSHRRLPTSVLMASATPPSFLRSGMGLRGELILKAHRVLTVFSPPPHSTWSPYLIFRCLL